MPVTVTGRTLKNAPALPIQNTVFRWSLAVSLAALFALPAAAHAGEGDIVVVRAPGVSAGAVRADADVELVKPLGIERAELVKPKDGDVREALADLRADDDVVSAEADQRVRAATPNDPYWHSLWGLENDADTDIDALEAWTLSVGGGVTVAVVDTGIDRTHADLAGQITGNPGEIGGGRERNGIDDDGNGYVDDSEGWDF